MQENNEDSKDDTLRQDKEEGRPNQKEPQQKRLEREGWKEDVLRKARHVIRRLRAP
jgi:hypothetical protein